MGKARVNARTANTLAYRAKVVVVQPNPAVERTVASKLACRSLCALDSCRGNGDVSRVMQKSWRRGAHVPWQALGHGCKGLPPQPMMFAKEEPLDDHHHYRL